MGQAIVCDPRQEVRGPLDAARGRDVDAMRPGGTADAHRLDHSSHQAFVAGWNGEDGRRGENPGHVALVAEEAHGLAEPAGCSDAGRAVRADGRFEVSGKPDPGSRPELDCDEILYRFSSVFSSAIAAPDPISTKSSYLRLPPWDIC